MEYCTRCLILLAADGAALFYTSPLPATVSVLRQYVLHFLFAPNPPQPAIGSSDIPAPARNPFPFKEAANVLDRDRIVVPAGWDSYGKISILREGFQPARWAEAYDMDLESLSESNPQPHPEGGRAQFSVLVGGDRGPPPRTLPAIIQPTPEQAFLQQHYETLAKDPTRDPRATFKQPVGAEERFGGATGASGVVGPMGSSSFSLPSVEKALVEMEGGGERHRESVSERERPGPVKPGAAPPRRVRVTLILFSRFFYRFVTSGVYPRSNRSNYSTREPPANHGHKSHDRKFGGSDRTRSESLSLPLT